MEALSAKLGAEKITRKIAVKKTFMSCIINFVKPELEKVTELKFNKTLSNFLFKKTLIIGLGLIGGSFAKALRKNQISAEIFGCDSDFETLEMAQEQKAIDGIAALEDDISDFDFIIIATPLSSYEKIFHKLQNKISADAIIIDLGSIKNFKIKNLPQNFIPCHPIAGSQNTGFEYALEDLFFGRKFIICSENSARNKVAEVAKKIGCEVELLNAKEHDEIFALVSHLPQFLSFLTAEFSPKKIDDEFFAKAFRLDKSSPEIWEDIFKMNEVNLEKFYLLFFDELEEIIKNPEKIIVENSAIGIPSFDKKFLTENFTAIFFRTLVVKSFLKIPQIKIFQKHAGQGFNDFTSIVEVLNYDQQILADLVKKNQQKILKIFNSIS